MSKGPWRTKPDATISGMPGGVPYIIGNEAAERFSFYGMRSILVVFMTKYMLDAAGNDATITDEQAKGVFHAFVAAAYFTPMLGAIIADVLFGKYWTILTISLLYCLGHGLLALMDVGPHLGVWDMEPFLYSGLFFIALGAGGIKPCVSAHVGDQFGSGNKHLMTQVFNWFYFSINVGAAASQFATPWLLAEFGPAWAFGVPGVLMAIATFVFWLGRHKFIHVPPAGLNTFVKETFSPEGVRALINLSPLFLLFVPMFWAIFDQTGSAWVIQADQMNRDFGFVWLPSSIQAVNPVMILCGIPLFTYVVYPLVGKIVKVTPLRKIGVGLFITAGSFAVSGLIQAPIEAKGPDIATRMYADVASSLSGADAPADPARIASIAKTVIGAAENEADAATIAAATGRSVADLATRIGGDRFRGLIPSASEEALLAATGAEDLPGAIAAASDWDDERLAAYGLTHSSVTRAIPDDALAEAIPAGASAALVLALADVDTPSLAAAVKMARSVWVKDMGKADEAKIVGYLEEMPSIFWQFVAYFVLTSAEILVSIVCLEFAYSQSPRKMKSFVMGVYFLGVSLGNVFVSGVNFVLEALKDENGVSPLDGANYYWFFTIAMAVVAVVYVFWSQTYKGQTYIQGEDDEEVVEAEAEAEGVEKG